MMALALVLTGAYAGKTILLNNRTFIRGRLPLEGPLSQLEHLVQYYGTAYNAYLEGSEELTRAQERDRCNRAANHPNAAGNGEGDSSNGAVGQPSQGSADDGGPTSVASSNDSLVGRAAGDSSPAVHSNAAASFANAKTAKMIAVLKGLDPSNDEHWTAAGLPMILALEQSLGQTGIMRKDVDAVLPGWNREKATAEVVNPTK
jgi:hypothetical protein